MKFCKSESYRNLCRKAANLLSAVIIIKPDAVLGLATGSTPLGVYAQLVDWYRKGDLDFSRITAVNLDEYLGFGGEHPQSYRYYMNRNLYDHVNIDLSRTFVPNGCAPDPELECREYDRRIERLGGIDIQLLGIGLDGHIGFNEPADCFETRTRVVDLDPSTIQANSRFFSSVQEVPRQAITMGMGAIMQAKRIALIANGKEKQDILNAAFSGPITPRIPASILQLHPDITVFYTEESAGV